MSKLPRLRVAVLISGSGTNLQAIIDAQASDTLNIDIVAVLSDQPTAFGLSRAADAGIQTIAINCSSFKQRADYDKELARALAELQPDLVVLAGYMRILPATTVNAWQGRMLNVHPSLLPAYPGLHTHARVLTAGESWHGTTVHYVTPELDAGPAILQYRVAVHAHETEALLLQRVQRGEYIIYPQAIRWIANGRLQFIDGSPVLDGQKLTQPVVIDESR